MSPKAKEIKATPNKWVLIKFKTFAQKKKTFNKMKRRPIDWEKIFANDITNKGFIYKIYKWLTKFSIKKTNNLIKRWTEDLNRPFSKEDIQMTNKHMKIY